MKLLKLVYIAHGWYLGLFSKPLINSRTEAWKFGPVIRPVYHGFKSYGHGDIDKMNLGMNEITNDYQRLSENQEDTGFLEKVWDVYKEYSGLQLSELTHRPGTPWDITWNKNGGSLMSGAIIPNDLIQSHYNEKANS